MTEKKGRAPENEIPKKPNPENRATDVRTVTEVADLLHTNDSNEKDPRQTYQITKFIQTGETEIKEDQEIVPARQSDKDMLKRLNFLARGYFSDSERVSNEARIDTDGVIRFPTSDLENAQKLLQKLREGNAFIRMRVDELWGQLANGSLLRRDEIFKKIDDIEQKIEKTNDRKVIKGLRRGQRKLHDAIKAIEHEIERDSEENYEARAVIIKQAIALGKSLGLQREKMLTKDIETVARLYPEDFRKLR